MCARIGGIDRPSVCRVQMKSGRLRRLRNEMRGFLRRGNKPGSVLRSVPAPGVRVELLDDAGAAAAVHPSAAAQRSAAAATDLSALLVGLCADAGTRYGREEEDDDDEEEEEAEAEEDAEPEHPALCGIVDARMGWAQWNRI